MTVSRQLRASGHTDYVRRARHVADRSAAKRALAARARAAQDEAAHAANTLTGLGIVSVSEINDWLGGPVGAVTLRLLASLLYRAIRGTRRRDGTRHALSVDGHPADRRRRPAAGAGSAPGGNYRHLDAPGLSHLRAVAGERAVRAEPGIGHTAAQGCCLDALRTWHYLSALRTWH